MMVFLKGPVKDIPVNQIELQFHDKSGQLSLSVNLLVICQQGEGLLPLL